MYSWWSDILYIFQATLFSEHYVETYTVELYFPFREACIYFLSERIDSAGFTYVHGQRSIFIPDAC